ncbi:MAG: flagellar biosynthesis anti-sigma factor FlgM [Anaerolineaceae bacterium]|nr:flagellar biosynthesis anti-sigma factor FlgM [Anaerolineaceae bacterium]
MNIGGTNGVGGPQNVYPKKAPGQAPKAGAPQNVRQTDRVEISDAARVRDAISRVADMRTEKVARAREMIASGEMDTPQRMDVAVDRLLDELMGL